MCNTTHNIGRGTPETGRDTMDLAARLISEGTRMIESERAKELAILKAYVRTPYPSPLLIEQVRSIAGLTPTPPPCSVPPSSPQLLGDRRNRTCGCDMLHHLALSHEKPITDIPENRCCLIESGPASSSSYQASGSDQQLDWSQLPLSSPMLSNAGRNRAANEEDAAQLIANHTHTVEHPHLMRAALFGRTLDSSRQADDAFEGFAAEYLQDSPTPWSETGLLQEAPSVAEIDWPSQMCNPIQRESLPTEPNSALDPLLQSDPLSIWQPMIGVADNQLTNMSLVAPVTSSSADDGVKASSPTDKPKPVCWDHDCQGRQFSSWSNLRRHQRERSGENHACHCPRCGAFFTRTSGRDQHLANSSCNRIWRYSNGRVRPSALKVQEALKKYS